MREYQFGEAQRVIHDFLWNEYCDWYIEMSKIRLRSGEAPSPLPVLAHVLEKTLLLLHPFLPFVTEEIWRRLTGALPATGSAPEAAIVAPYPQADDARYDADAEREVGAVVELVRAARNLRSEFRIPEQPAARRAANCGCRRQRRRVRLPRRPAVHKQPGADRPQSRS